MGLEDGEMTRWWDGEVGEEGEDGRDGQARWFWNEIG